MPRPVCIKCSREMSNIRPVTMQFNARAVGGAYEQWHGDLHKCSGCGAQIITGYGNSPSWRHPAGPESAETPHVIVEER